MVGYRYLGNSGFKISEITLGNWVTHGSQVGDDAAIKTVHAALDAGITAFDTADTYANTAAEVVLGKALEGQRRESLEIFTKVYFPTGPQGPNDTGLSRKHIMESINGSLKRLGTDYVDLYRPTASTTKRRSKRPSRPSPTSSARARRSTSVCPSGPRSSCAKVTRSRSSSASS